MRILAFVHKTPPIKLVVTKEQFNAMVERISLSENCDSTELKEKLLKFSIPREDNSIFSVEIGLFPNEAANLIKILMTRALPEVVKTDYFSVLVRVHKELSRNEQE